MSLRKKIIGLCVGNILLVAITISGFLIVRMNALTDDVVASNNTFSELVGQMSSDSMTGQMRKRMMELTSSNASLANAKFEELEKQVVLLANMTEKIFADPDSYGLRKVEPPVADNDGSLSVQFLHSASIKDLDTPELTERIGLLANMQDTLYEVNRGFENMASDYIALEPGIMIQADYISGSKFDENGAVLPYEADTRPWYQGAKETKKPYFTPVTRDAHSTGTGIMCGVPIYVDGEFLGVAGAGMYLSDIEQLVADIRLGSAGYACIINQSGQVIFSPTESGMLMVDVENQTDLRATDNLALSGVVRSVLAGSKGITTLEMDGEKYCIAYAPMDKVGWGFLTVLGEEEVKEPTNNLLRELNASSKQTVNSMQKTVQVSLMILIAAFMIFCLIGAVLAFVVSMHIVRPIRILTDRVSQVDGDNLDFTWELKNKDETDVLANSFLAMTQKMKEYIKNITEITAEKERIGAELNVATKIQADMLPKIFPPFPDRTEFDVYAQMTPAKEVGGDFYDFFLVDDDHLAIVIADVSSKGVPAALFMVIAKTLIKNHAMSLESLGDVFYRVNNQLCEGNEEGMFVTAWMGVITLTTGELEYVNAGHNPQLLMNNADYDWIHAQPGFVLAGLEGIPYTSEKLMLKHGARIFLYTDGVTEAQNTSEELFGEDRLLDSLQRNGHLPLQQMLEAVRADIDTFAGEAEQFDDITMLAFEFV
ncbi:MAG: SpoIIE family protein phosphatase [bacterium]|nr:SpoIIE family protein phosphatase [bacterium]MDY4098743.1 SpoIIE family protein phosphatase [Lachnospiraceae bacterium]